MGCYGSKPGALEDAPRSVPSVQSYGDASKEDLECSRKAVLSLLGTRERGHLVDRNGKKVKVDTLKGHTIGLLFSAHAVPSAREFTRILNEVYKELRSKGKLFEVVFISNDESSTIWKESMKEMSWLAIPFSDRDSGDNLGAKFQVSDIPTLIIIDSEGNKVCEDGVETIQNFGSKSWPFNSERIQILRQEQEREQSNNNNTNNDHKNFEKQDRYENGFGNSIRNTPRESQVAPEF